MMDGSIRPRYKAEFELSYDASDDRSAHVESDQNMRKIAELLQIEGVGLLLELRLLGVKCNDGFIEGGEQLCLPINLRDGVIEIS